jgi:hypothetical protein
MKAYFRYSPRDDHATALRIYNTIIKLGHSHVSDFAEKIHPENFYTENEHEWAIRYSNSMKEMDRADVCFLETSIPSTAIGQLGQIAVEKFKPTILLYRQGKRPYYFRGLAEAEKRVQLLEYTPETLDTVLTFAFEFAEEFINTRFTLLFPPDIMAHLNKMKKSGNSRSKYIRTLIRKDMK